MLDAICIVYLVVGIQIFGIVKFILQRRNQRLSSVMLQDQTQTYNHVQTRTHSSLDMP